MSKFDLLLYEGNSRHLSAHIVLGNSRTLFRTNYINMGPHEREVQGDQIYRHPHLLYIDRLVQKKRNSSAICTPIRLAFQTDIIITHYCPTDPVTQSLSVCIVESMGHLWCVLHGHVEARTNFTFALYGLFLVSLLQWKCQTYIPIQVNYFHISRIKTESYSFPFDDR